MSTLAAGDGQSPMPDGHMNREAVPELVQLFQAQSASAGPSQGNGARDIFKAGHRRLRQLALRQKKTTDPKSKAEEASRQLLALQEEGFLPAPKAKKPVPSQTSIDSTISSQSATNLSVKSDSRRDVERIGQPWLGDPLERVRSHEPIGTQPSSFDLRELTSLVQSAVSFPSQLEDSIPPPYQPSPNPTPAPATEIPEKPPGEHPSVEQAPVKKQAPDQNEGTPSNTPDSSTKADSGDKNPQAAASPSGGDPKPEDKKPQEAKAAEGPHTQATSQPPSASASQALKLFPDTLPPRVSSKAAWRISNGRSPGLNRYLGNDSLQSPKFGSMQPEHLNFRMAANDRPKSPDPRRLVTHSGETAVKATRGNRSLTNSPINERFPQHRSIRRPSSLPLGAINSFPLPAPMRPLPSLPEPVARINTNRSQAPSASGKPTETAKSGSTPQTQAPSQVMSIPKPENDQAKPPLVQSTENTDDKEPGEPCKIEDTVQGGITPFVRNGQTRAERVRALRMKDLSASQLNINGDKSKGAIEQPLRSPRFETIPERLDEHCDETQGDSEEQRAKRDSNDIASSALSPPALNLHPRPANQPGTGKRSCSSPLHFKASSEASNRSSISTSNRSSAISRSSSSRSSNISRERNDGQDIYSRSETPLPSSDDECMDPHKHESPTKRRCLKPAPIVVSDASAPRRRHAKKQSSQGYPIPTTPQKRSRGLERMSPQSQKSESTYYSQDSRGSRHYQSAYVLSLEGRIAHLERQNKILQAALLAALDLGDKPSVETLLGGSGSSLSTPNTGRSFSSMTNASSYDERPMRDERRKRSKNRPPYRPENWIASPGSSRRSSFSDESGEQARELEEMIEDFDFGWPSDKSSFDRAQRPGIRA
ncbi:hypothetical protein BDV59DRAFT_204181 [Aspergillus ambiguus]|uniref:uncharacterized protein n=1 Tax=Aspergillus ambiguus TaxID=176160 RepID=UPI003CCCCCDB